MNAMKSLTEAEFIEEIRRRMPADPGEIGPSTPVKSLATNKTSSGTFWLAMRELMPGAPSDLISSITTLHDAYDWYSTRSAHVGPEESVMQRVQLRPLVESDYASIYLAASSPEQGFRWRYRGVTPSIQDFHRQLFDGVLAQFMVIDRASGSPYGLVCAYNAQLDNQCAYIGFLRTAPTEGKGEVLEGVVLFIELLFRNWNFRKLYAEVPAFNAEGMFDEHALAIRIEGRLVDHCFYNGRWWDQLIVALWRDDWINDSSLRPIASTDQRLIQPSA